LCEFIKLDSSINQFSELVNLDLGWCKRISNKGINYIALLGNKKLERINLETCTGFSDEGVVQLAQCTNLKYLNLKNTLTSDEGLVPIILNCLKLENLNISGLIRLTPPVIQTIALKLTNLIEINIADVSKSHRRESSYLELLFKSCSNLQLIQVTDGVELPKGVVTELGPILWQWAFSKKWEPHDYKVIQKENTTRIIFSGTTHA